MGSNVLENHHKPNIVRHFLQERVKKNHLELDAVQLFRMKPFVDFLIVFNTNCISQPTDWALGQCEIFLQAVILRSVSIKPI